MAAESALITLRVSGLALSNAKNVKLWSNVVKARYSDDKAYEVHAPHCDCLRILLVPVLSLSSCLGQLRLQIP